MGRTVGKIAKIVGIGILVGVTAGGLGLLGGAFVAGTAATATAAATAATLFGVATSTLTAIAIGATIIGGLLAPPRFSPEATAAAQGTLLSLNARRDAPRLILYGEAATGGDLMYQEAINFEAMIFANWASISLAKDLIPSFPVKKKLARLSSSLVAIDFPAA